MYDQTQDLLDALRATPLVLTGLLHGCSEEQAHTTREGEGGWSPVEVVSHLRDAEAEALARMRTMRDQSEPMLAAYDQEQWAKHRSYTDAHLYEALDAFRRLRAQHIADLEQLAAEQWERVGHHEEYGRVTISSHTLHIVSHDCVHLAQISRHVNGLPL
jgi:hypothetical protein